MEKINDFDIQIQSDEIGEDSDWVNDWESDDDTDEFIDDWLIRPYRLRWLGHQPFTLENSDRHRVGSPVA